MADPLLTTLRIGSSGLEAQSLRLRVIAENMANAEATGRTPGSDPYTRKVITFESELEEAANATLVRVSGIERQRTPYRVEHLPGHPAADVQGFVRFPNVNLVVEAADMREANRSYEANLQAIRQAREMINMTLDLLRST
jgi:flagellar basal-body rod protein FlgC